MMEQIVDQGVGRGPFAVLPLGRSTCLGVGGQLQLLTTVYIVLTEVTLDERERGEG